ncbi:hypothetical protein BH20ACT21_BH20ACT21_17100 [soil metagenome]
MSPGVRIGAVQTKAVAARKPGYDRRLTRARRASDPENVLHPAPVLVPGGHLRSFDNLT